MKYLLRNGSRAASESDTFSRGSGDMDGVQGEPAVAADRPREGGFSSFRAPPASDGQPTPGQRQEGCLTYPQFGATAIVGARITANAAAGGKRNQLRTQRPIIAALHGLPRSPLDHRLVASFCNEDVVAYP
jgi:hypothetical protein